MFRYPHREGERWVVVNNVRHPWPWSTWLPGVHRVYERLDEIDGKIARGEGLSSEERRFEAELRDVANPYTRDGHKCRGVVRNSVESPDRSSVILTVTRELARTKVTQPTPVFRVLWLCAPPSQAVCLSCLRNQAAPATFA